MDEHFSFDKTACIGIYCIKVLEDQGTKIKPCSER